MAFNITGQITVSDVRDGVSAPVVLLSNENHTFPADEAGAIVGDLTGFTTNVAVFVGTQAYTYTAAATTAVNQFRVVSLTASSGADLTATADASGNITVVDADSTGIAGFVDTGSASATITVVISVNGITGNISRTITLAKSLGGSAPIVRLVTSSQTVNYDGEGVLVTGQGNIVLTASYTDAEGAPTWTSSSGGAAFQALTGAGVTAGAAPGNTVGSGTQTYTISPAAYNTLLGSNRFVTFRVVRGGASDQVTVARLDAGRNALTVEVTVIEGSQILRGDTQTVRVRADVFQNGALLTPGGDWTYAWSKDGTALSATNQAAQTGATQQTNEGFNSQILRIEGDGIADNTASLFSVTVVDPS